MPVEDHPTLQKNIIGSSHLNGCHNRPPFKDGYWAPDREYHQDGRYTETTRFIPFRNSTECRFDQVMNPERCDGCIHINPKYATNQSKEKHHDQI